MDLPPEIPRDLQTLGVSLEGLGLPGVAFSHDALYSAFECLRPYYGLFEFLSGFLRPLSDHRAESTRTPPVTLHRIGIFPANRQCHGEYRALRT